MIKQPKTGPQGNGEEKDTVQISSYYSFYCCVRFITWKSPKTHDSKTWSDWMPMICLAVTKHSTSVQTLTSLTGTFGIGCIVLWRYFLAAVCVLSPNNLSFSCFAGQYEDNLQLPDVPTSTQIQHCFYSQRCIYKILTRGVNICGNTYFIWPTLKQSSVVLLLVFLVKKPNSTDQDLIYKSNKTRQHPRGWIPL